MAAAAKKATGTKAARPVEDPEICLECFPGGWGPPMPEDGYAAGCSHGQYTHPGRKPNEDGTQTVLDVDDAEDDVDEDDVPNL